MRTAPGPVEHDAAPAGIAPSDLGQSVVRLLLVALLSGGAVVRLAPPGWDALVHEPIMVLCLAFFAFTLLNAGATVIIQRLASQPGAALTVQRSVGIATDTAACAAYAILSGTAGVVVFPLFLTIVIGYGLRFGLGYMVGALVAALVAVTAVARQSPAFAPSGAALTAYYLALIVVPLYTASLVRKYQRVLAALRRAHASRARFVSVVSHELRTPLHAMLGQAEGIENDVEAGPRARAAAAAIIDSGDQLRAIVNDLLDAAAGDAGALQLGEASDIDLPELLAAVMPVATTAARDKPLTFEVHYHDDAPRRVRAPARELRQALTNVIANAAKYCDEGRVEVDVQARIATGGIACLDITVTDDGPGIANELEEVLFEPFTVGRRRAGTDSTGLGLPLTRHYVEAMGGSISVSSTPGVGTSVRLTLPATAPAEETEPAAPLRLPPARVATIAIIDDNVLNRRLTAATLRADGHAVLEFDRPRHALAVLTDSNAPPVDLLIVDFHFDDGPGDAFLQRYRTLAVAPAPALYLSADGSGPTRARAFAAGAAAYLTKPVRPSQLAVEVQRILAERRAQTPGPAPSGSATVPLVDPGKWNEMVDAGIDDAILDTAIAGFGADSALQLERIRRCIESADATALRTAIHRLEGTAAAVFAARLGQHLAGYRGLEDDCLVRAVRTDLTATEALLGQTRRALTDVLDASNRCNAHPHGPGQRD